MDSVELEQLALLFSRLDTDHDGVLMFGEFLPAHLPPILLPSSSHPPPILLRLFPVSRRVLPVHPAGEPLAARALHGERAASHVPQVRSQRRATSLYLLLLSLLLSLLTTHYSLLTTYYSLLSTLYSLLLLQATISSISTSSCTCSGKPAGSTFRASARR